jgi:ribosomal-protein-alanine N-acetyltransferase
MICRTCSFVTDRLIAREWHSLSADDWVGQDLAVVVRTMLTPHVTQSLPEGWKGDYTTGRATTWIKERDREGATLLVLDRSSRVPIGLMILFESDDEQPGRTVRLGYLLSASAWGQGLASELVRGFVDWCRTVKIAALVGGVERDNIPSQRALEKNRIVIQPTAEDHGELFFKLRF